jgi:hypothetical protein
VITRIRYPKGLPKKDRDLFAWMIEEYGITDSAGIAILQTAVNAKTEESKCMAIINAEGYVFYDRFGKPKVHPLATVIRDSRSQYLLALKSLNMDIEPLKNTKR